MRAFLENISPLNNAVEITKPLFIEQGMNDPIVPLSESEAMVAALRKNGDPGLVLNGQGRRSWVCQREELRFLIVGGDSFHEGVFC